MKNVAVVSAQGLGDALIYMVLSHNLSRSNIKVTTFSSILCELKDWFGSHTILPFPRREDIHRTFTAFDTVIAADHSMILDEHRFGNHLCILKENAFDKKRTLVDNLVHLCETRFQARFPNKENGISAPEYLTWRKFPKRVVIHPTSTELRRNWTPKKFLTLKALLEKKGFEPIFCVSPKEKEDWPDSPLFPKISDLAAFIYESGYMIGNNSGLGHLASVLNIPTLSLFARESYSRLWRPGWGLGLVVTPPNIVIGAALKQRLWKTLLSPSKVLNAFENLVKIDREKNASASFSHSA